MNTQKAQPGYIEADILYIPEKPGSIVDWEHNLFIPDTKALCPKNMNSVLFLLKPSVEFQWL